MEHRWGQRMVVDIPIRMTIANTLLWMQARLENLSVTGALVTADRIPRLLSLVQIVIGTWPSRLGHDLSINAYVARHYRHGIGVEWCESASTTVTELLKAARDPSLSRQHARVVNFAKSPAVFAGDDRPVTLSAYGA